MAAREKWPDATIDDDALAAVLGAHLGAQRDPVAALARLRIDDLLLAQWCATGDPRAIAAFERVHRADVEGVLARFRRLAMTHEELLQTLRIKLFVATEGRPPRITEYSGFGFLQNWLRVTALRAMVDAARSEKARRLEELLADDDLLGVPALGPDLAARVSREEVGRAIKQAFARAVAELAPRQRNFLRHAHVDQLTLEQIAATYGIHRATVARTLAQARAESRDRDARRARRAARHRRRRAGQRRPGGGQPDRPQPVARAARAGDRRRRRGGPMSGCPSEDELVRMVEGALGDASLASIESHVDHCERCAAVIAGLGALAAGSGGAGRARGGLAAGTGGAGGAMGSVGAAGGRVVGRYQLDRRIAAGGMGEVWAAWDPQLRREIAVKLVRPDRADDGRERERLLREARALARLGHPNVLAVHDVGELDGEVFIATELVAGETLASRGGPSASWRELVRLYTQAARGLAAAHAAGLVHRDVKPSNLLLGADGRVRVADFGLAVRSSAPSPVAATELPTDEVPVSITASGFIAGTPAYMAPEQRAGHPPDARADQYALCVSLVEALDGRRPVGELDRDALIAFISERRPREPELDALCGVLARGLSIDPRRRFPDTGALADALERGGGGVGSGVEVGGGVGVGSGVGSGSGAGSGVGAGSSGSVREIESAVTVSAKPLAVAATAAAPVVVRPRSGTGSGSHAPPPSSGSHAPPPSSGSYPPASSSSPHAPSSDAYVPPPPSSGSHPPASSSGPHAHAPSSGPHSSPPGSGSHPPSSGPLPRATASLDSSPRAPAPARRRPRRFVSVAIAVLAAAAGVAVVLLAARFALKKPARAPDTVAVGSAAPAPVPGPAHIEPITPPTAEGSGAPPQVIAEGSGHAPGRPAGAPLDTPHAPPKTVAVAPPITPAGAIAAVSSFITDVQKHIRHHDARGCRKLVAGLPSNIPPSARFSVEIFAAFCDMMAGDCAGGTARLGRAHAAQGQVLQPAMYTDQYCPIEGDLETRVTRLRSQVSAHTMGPAMDLAWCDALIPPTRKAAGEASTGPQRGVVGFALLQLAKCVGGAGRCDEARGLWSLASTIDDSIKWRKPDLGAPCAAATAALTATEAYADPSALLQSLSGAIRMNDVPGCQKLLASAPANVAPGHKHSIDLLHAHCEMMGGNCAAGTARLGKLEPNGPGGSPVDPSIKAAWVKSHVEMYCPIAGDLDARIARLWAKVDAFTSRGGGGLIAVVRRARRAGEDHRGRDHHRAAAQARRDVAPAPRGVHGRRRPLQRRPRPVGALDAARSECAEQAGPRREVSVTARSLRATAPNQPSLPAIAAFDSLANRRCSARVSGRATRAAQ